MPTILQYRRALAYALDDLGVYTVSAATSNTVTLGALVDVTTNASATRYDGAWVYLASGAGANQSRRVIRGGFTPSSGALALELTWTIPAPGDQVEITRLFPGTPNQVNPEDTDYRTLVTRALEKVIVPDRISLAITTSDTYSLTAYSWLDREERLVGMVEPAPILGRASINANWRGPRLILDGASPVLQLNTPFEAASGFLALDVLRPGHTLIDGAESTVGFTAEGQSALPTVQDLLPVMLLEAYTALAHRSRGTPDGANWERKRAMQEDAARRLRYYDTSRERPATPQEAA